MRKNRELDALGTQTTSSSEEIECDEDGIVFGVVVLKPEMEVLKLIKLRRTNWELANVIHDSISKYFNLEGIFYCCNKSWVS